MSARTSPILCDKALKMHKHVCAIFNSRAEARDIIGEFIAEGCRQGERTTMLLDPAIADESKLHLEGHGVEVDKLTAAGMFDIKTWEDSYLQDGTFNGDAVLEFVATAMRAARAAGHPRVWITGDMNWAGQNPGNAVDLIAYESRLNELKPEFEEDLWICFYDASQANGKVIADIIRAHPVVLLGNRIFENPFYTPPAEFLKELAAWENYKPVKPTDSKIA